MKHEGIFEAIEPPRGGLIALREKLDRAPGRSWRGFALASAVACAVVLAIVFLRSGRDDRALLMAARADGSSAAIALGLTPLPDSHAVIANESRGTTALAPVATANPNVSFYWVSSASWHD